MERRTQKPSSPRLVVGEVTVEGRSYWRILLTGGSTGTAVPLGWEDTLFSSYTKARSALAWYRVHGGTYSNYVVTKRIQCPT